MGVSVTDPFLPPIASTQDTSEHPLLWVLFHTDGDRFRELGKCLSSLHGRWWLQGWRQSLGNRIVFVALLGRAYVLET